MRIEEDAGGSVERSLLTGQICVDSVCGRIADRWEAGGLYDSPHGNLVGGWCVDFFKRYGKAPGRSVEAYFHSWREAGADEDLAGVVERLLQSLSQQHEKLQNELNADHLLDVASDHFNRVRLLKQANLVINDVAAGDLKRALTRWESTKPLEMGSEGWVDPLTDRAGMVEALKRKSLPLIRYESGVGEFFGSTLERGGFVALLAAEKRGKSQLLMEFVWQAAMQGLRTAYFVVGDMSMTDIRLRLARRMARRPIEAGKVLYPVDLHVSGNKATVKHRVYDYRKEMTESQILKAMDMVDETYKGDRCRVSVHAGGSISVTGIRSVLSRWERDGFVCDACVIDYADVLAPLSSKDDKREQINQTWLAMRRLSQEAHCLTLTATQADADSYNTDLLRRSNFSEDKRKYAHVTAMFGQNMTDGEKKSGQSRLNWLVRREGEYNETEVCFCAGSLAIARPIVLSHFRGVS